MNHRGTGRSLESIIFLPSGRNQIANKQSRNTQSHRDREADDKTVEHKICQSTRN